MGKTVDGLYKNVMPTFTSHYIFIKCTGYLHKVRHSPSTLKKPI
jgi:hypothetical protein